MYIYPHKGNRYVRHRRSYLFRDWKEGAHDCARGDPDSLDPHAEVCLHATNRYRRELPPDKEFVQHNAGSVTLSLAAATAIKERTKPLIPWSEIPARMADRVKHFQKYDEGPTGTCMAMDGILQTHNCSQIRMRRSIAKIERIEHVHKEKSKVHISQISLLKLWKSPTTPGWRPNGYKPNKKTPRKENI